LRRLISIKYPHIHITSMQSLGTCRIETERLALRRFAESDIEDTFRNYGSDPLVNRYISFAPCSTIEGTREFIGGHIIRYMDDPDFYGWAISLDGKVIGSIGLFDIDKESESCEIGYSLGSRWWGKGYATESVNAVLRYAFESIRLHRVQATYHPDNRASARVLDKVGMKYEGTIRDGQRNPDGTFIDLILCARLSTDER